MELGHILWPSDPVTRESSDPETQLTQWPCSIMNSKIVDLCVAEGVCESSFLLLEYSVEYLIEYSSTQQGK